MNIHPTRKNGAIVDAAFPRFFLYIFFIIFFIFFSYLRINSYLCTKIFIM